MCTQFKSNVTFFLQIAYQIDVQGLGFKTYPVFYDFVRSYGIESLPVLIHFYLNYHLEVKHYAAD
jgi:hypothetical protein